MEETKRDSQFTDKEHYAQFIEAWKEVTNDVDRRKELTLENFILYRILRGKDWRACLSPSSSEETISSASYYAFDCKYPSLWPFGKTVTLDMIQDARLKGLKKWGEV